MRSCRRCGRDEWLARRNGKLDTDTTSSYQPIAQAYADGVRALFSPPAGQVAPTGEPAVRCMQVERGAVSNEQLADRAEQLSPVSVKLTEATSAQLDAADPIERMEAST